MWVTENRTLSIDCIAEGVPTPKLSWWRDGRAVTNDDTEEFEVLGEGTRLLIKNAHPNDAGRYSCKAVNEAGASHKDSDSEYSAIYRRSQCGLHGRSGDRSEIRRSTA